MTYARLVTFIQSRAFARVCYAALALLVSAYLFRQYRTHGASSREVNISCFAYRDINRNGIYDLEDRPFAGLEATLRRPAGGPVRVASNISGFANFKMGFRRRSADVRDPGQYTIEVTPPAGWRITSGNGVQTIALRRDEESAVGLVAARSFLPVGVAPDLVIRGNTGTTSPGSPPLLRAQAPGGRTVDVPVSSAGDFSIPAESGEWILSLSVADGAPRRRTVTVKNYPVTVSALATAAPAPPAAKRSAGTVDFDSLTPSDTLYEIPNNYSGFTWANWVASHQKLYRSDGMVNGTVSSEYVAYNSSGFPAMIGSETGFDLVGVFLGMSWPEGERHDVVITAWRGDVLAYQDRVRVSSRGPVYFAAEYRSITRVEFASMGSWQMVIDDLEFRRD